MLEHVRRAVVTLLLVLVPIQGVHAYHQALVCPPYSDSGAIAADDTAVDRTALFEDHGSGSGAHQQHACCHHFAWGGVSESAVAAEGNGSVVTASAGRVRPPVYLKQPHRPPIPT